MDNSIHETTLKFANQVKLLYNPLAVYLYGSHANGTATDASDIDIAVVFSPMEVHERMDILSGLLSLAAKIDASIEPNVVIDDGKCSKYSLLAQILETGIRIDAHNKEDI